MVNRRDILQAGTAAAALVVAHGMGPFVRAIAQQRLTQAELLNFDPLGNVTRLDLMGNDIGPTGAAALAGSPHVSNLTWLNLEWNRFDAAGAVALAASPSLSRLRTLKLDSTDIGDEGILALAQSPHLVNLEELELSTTDITPD